MHQNANEFYFRSPEAELTVNTGFLNGLIHSQGHSNAIQALKNRVKNSFPWLDDTTLFVDFDVNGVPVTVELGNING